MDLDDGGPAFPPSKPSTAKDQQGMTLRDWFAGQALTGLLASNPGLTESNPCGDAKDVPGLIAAFAKAAYAMADVMLEARRHRE